MKESYRTYRLYVWYKYPVAHAKKHWRPVGCEELTLGRALIWLKADLDIWRELPNAKYKVERIIHWQSTTRTVKKGIRG